VSPAYAAKILRVLRKGGFVKAARGKDGGYTLARPAQSISIGDVIDALGGRIFESNFCDSHAGQAVICTRSVDCSVRSLWRAVQVAVDQVLHKATLRDLLQNEEEMNSWIKSIPGPNGLTLIHPKAVDVEGTIQFIRQSQAEAEARGRVTDGNLDEDLDDIRKLIQQGMSKLEFPDRDEFQG